MFFLPKFSLKIALPILLSVLCTLSYAQTGTVTSTVKDAKNQPLIGVTVVLVGTTNGAITDIDGKFTILNVPLGSQKLKVSFVGFTIQEINVEVKDGINTIPAITLKEDALLLNDVVVVGYGTQIKREVSSSVSTVKASDLGEKQGYNFASGIQGEAAGVQVTTNSGVAGAGTSIRVRGTKSLSNDAEPLYVVDGVPIISYDISNAVSTSGYNVSPLSNINPNDIESIEILKDASATAIYGARGANGVVIITTKQGKSGKTRVDISSSAGMSQAAHKLKLLDGPQYLELSQEAWNNDGHTGNVPLTGGLTRDQIANTNWVDKMLRTGYFTENNISASGGDAKTNFYVGGGIRDEKSFLVGNEFTRSSVRANINHDANRFFSFGINTGLTYTYNKYVPTSVAGGLGAAQSTMLPIYPVYNADGTYFLANQNPLAQINLSQGNNHTWRNITNANMTVNFTKNLSFRNEFGIDLIHEQEEFYQPKELTGTVAYATDRRDQYFTWNYTSTLDYKKDFNEKHGIDVMVGFNPTETTEKFSYIQGKDLVVSSQTQVQSTNPDSIVAATAGTGRQFSFASFFTRINYKLLNRHLFQISFRADGSSRFGSNNRFGYFPAASYAWIISDEKFMQKQKVFSLLKFRASVGMTGNAGFTDDFAYFSAYSSGQNYAGVGGIGPNTIAVNDLRWESTTKTDIGFDFGVLKNRLSGTFDFYNETTNNVLVSGAPLTPSSGYTSVTRNLGSLYNRGVELQLVSNNLGPKSPVEWKTIVNIAANRNKVTDLGGVQEVDGTNYGNNAAIVGQPVGVWLLAKYAGVDPQTGKPMIYDFDGNKVEATATNTVKYRQPVGNPYPKFQGGFKNTFKFKGIELEAFFVFSVGNDIYDDDGKRHGGNMSYGWNQDISALNRWQQPGDVTDVPKLSYTANYDVNTTRYLYNASFLRLRTLTLAYNLPERVVKLMHMRAFRIFVSGQNLATVTKYPGWDPETNRDNSGAITQGVTYLATPQARTVSGGINIGF